MKNSNAIISQASKIAQLDLDACLKEEGVLASLVNFSDFWARDSFWTCQALLCDKYDADRETDLKIVKKSIELFLKYQHPNGKIPRKICLDYNLLKYLGIELKRRKPRPIYTSGIKFFFSLDDNLLFVIVFCSYVELTKDYAFANKYFNKVKKALFFQKHKNLIKNSLLEEFGLSNWMDTVFKNGFVLYTNCLWFKAVEKYEQLEKIYQTSKAINKNETDNININDSSINNIPKSKAILSQIQKTFWSANNGYFIDNVSLRGKPQNFFDLAGNSLCLLFDIANHKQTESILNKITSLKKGNDDKQNPAKLHPINNPLYPFWKIMPLTYLFGIGRYHNGIAWSWTEALAIIAQFHSRDPGDIKKAKKNLLNFSKIIIKNKHVHETYNLNGSPFDHHFWKSAVPFAWGAGMFLWAVSENQKAITQ